MRHPARALACSKSVQVGYFMTQAHSMAVRRSERWPCRNAWPAVSSPPWLTTLGDNIDDVLDVSYCPECQKATMSAMHRVNETTASAWLAPKITLGLTRYLGTTN